MTSFLQDLRYGVRMLVRNKGLTLVAAISIALGTGGNTAMFSIINGMFFRPLPFYHPGQLTVIWSFNTQRDQGGRYMSYPDFVDLRTRSQTIESMAAWSMRDFVITGQAEPLRISAAEVDAAIFQLLGKQPFLGRAFDPTANADRQSVILSHTLWKEFFGAARDVVGHSVVVNGSSYTIIGVMPENFKFPMLVRGADVWLKMFPDGIHARRRARVVSVIGRLKQGKTLEEAGAELKSIAGALSLEYPQTNANISARVDSFSNHLFGNSRSSLYVLFGATGLVLLIACVTVANLLIARSSVRQREMAIRNAIGATRSRIIRLILIESMTLAVAGGILGTIFAFFACRMFVGLSPSEALQLRSINLDWMVAIFTVVLVLITGFLFGIIPALRLSRGEPAIALGERTSSATLGRNKRSTQGALIISQVAITLLLLVGAGLLINGLWRMRQVNLGVDTNNVLTVNLALPDSYNPHGIAAFYNNLQQQLQAIPTVRSASAVIPLPFTGYALSSDFEIEGHLFSESSQPNADLILAQPGYFKTMGVMLLEGRDFGEQDNESALPVAIINHALADRYFNGESPVGKRIRQQNQELTVVGVVGDIRHSGARSDVRPEIYVPLQQRPFPEIVAVLKSERPSDSLVTSVRGAVLKLDRNLPIYDVNTLDNRLESTRSQDRFNLILLSMFAGVALFLTLVGLHGVMAQFVEQRRREIAIRMAIGSSPSKVLKLIVGQGMTLVIVGLVLGIGLALGLTNFMKSMLFKVSATDPLTFLVVTLLMVAMALFACYMPAKTASGVDPMHVLRTE